MYIFTPSKRVKMTRFKRQTLSPHPFETKAQRTRFCLKEKHWGNLWGWWICSLSWFHWWLQDIYTYVCELSLMASGYIYFIDGFRRYLSIYKKLHTLNICILFYVHHTSMKLLRNKKQHWSTEQYTGSAINRVCVSENRKLCPWVKYR